jgi:hypothetical protein
MEDDPVCRPTSDLLKDGLAYWQRIRGSRLMPARADLDPVHIPRLLPHVMLIDVLREPLDFRFRLLGSKHDRILGDNYRGRLLSELPHMAKGTPIWELFEGVVTERRPVSRQLSYINASDAAAGFIEHCLMPLSSDGQTVDIVFAVSAITQAPPNPNRQAPL